MKNQKDRKDRYLTRLAVWLSTNAATEDIFGSKQPELQKDFQLANFLLQCGKFHLETTRNEICTALVEAQSGSLKSATRSSDLISNGEQCFVKKNYQDAVDYFSKAILYLPLNQASDYKYLATLYCRRMKCSLEMNEKRLAAIDIELAFMANADFANTLFDQNEIDLRNSYRYQFGENWVSSGELLSTFHPDVNASKSKNRNNRYSMKTTRPIEKNIPVLIEKPFVTYFGDNLKYCIRCSRRLESFRCWPCQFCVSVVFCSKDCYDKDFEYHKYECGITDYISQIPLMLIMLRFYVRSKQSPLSPCPISTDYIKLYLNAVREGDNGQLLALNAFRQCMDRHESRHLLEQNRADYFAVLIMAIEFLYLYDACCYNAHFMSLKRNAIQKDSSNNKNDTSHIDKRTEIKTDIPDTSPFESFSWAKEFDTKTEMISLIFRDMKRFLISPHVRFTLCPNNENNVQPDNKRDRQLFLLNSILFEMNSSNITNKPNVNGNFNRKLGQFMVRTSVDVPANQLLVRKLAKT